MEYNVSNGIVIKQKGTDKRMNTPRTQCLLSSSTLGLCCFPGVCSIIEASSSLKLYPKRIYRSSCIICTPNVGICKFACINSLIKSLDNSIL
jgi:hypothetical protein